MTSWEVFAAKCLIDPHSCGRHAEDACNRGGFFVSKGASFDLVWKVFTSLPVGRGWQGHRGRREGVNAHEAATQAAVVTGEGFSLVLDFLLLDVIPLSMGLETAGDAMGKLIKRNITCFTEKGQTFVTYADNQSGVLIRAFKGEHMMAEGNNSPEKSHLDGIPPAPCGLPEIEVIFDIDANGILSVSGTTLFVSRHINAYGVVGAFVLDTNDGGMFNEFVKDMHDAYKRISSHVSIVPQCAVRLRQLKTVLVGWCSNRDLWFQFEAGDWGPEENLCGSILHVGHYLESECSGLLVRFWVLRPHGQQPVGCTVCLSAECRSFWNLRAACDIFKAVAVAHTQGTLTSLF